MQFLIAGRILDLITWIKEELRCTLKQVYRFIFLYAGIAVLHGALMYVWADHYRLNYIAGFVVATGMQVLCSYWGNKRMVFKV